MNFINEAILEQFGPELAAGKHSEFPTLRRIWIENEIAKAEQAELRAACDEVVNDYYRWKD